MLVLDRRVSEGFWIDDRIYVKVLSIGKRRVKLGIEAPDDLEVVREELRGEKEPAKLPKEPAKLPEEPAKLPKVQAKRGSLRS